MTAEEDGASGGGLRGLLLGRPSTAALNLTAPSSGIRSREGEGVTLGGIFWMGCVGWLVTDPMGSAKASGNHPTWDKLFYILEGEATLSRIWPALHPGSALCPSKTRITSPGWKDSSSSLLGTNSKTARYFVVPEVDALGKGLALVPSGNRSEDTEVTHSSGIRETPSGGRPESWPPVPRVPASPAPPRF